MNNQLHEFLKNYWFGVLSTVDANGKPESAIVGYKHSAALELVIGTSKYSRKYKNIQQNSHVAMVVGNEVGEVQYEGTIAELSCETYDALVEQGVIEALPGSAKYRDDPTQVYLKITPTWVRFILHGETDNIEEFTEFSV